MGTACLELCPAQDQHSVIRAKIVQHMSDKAPLMLAHIVALPGNCLFRCFSYVVTGSQEHYQTVRASVVAHMPVIPNVFTTSDVASVHEYLNITGMADNGTWGNRQCRLCATSCTPQCMHMTLLPISGKR